MQLIVLEVARQYCFSLVQYMIYLGYLITTDKMTVSADFDEQLSLNMPATVTHVPPETASTGNQAVAPTVSQSTASIASLIDAVANALQSLQDSCAAQTASIAPLIDAVVNDL